MAQCERDQYKGQITHIDRPLLFRLVELGVESIKSPASPFSMIGTSSHMRQIEAAEDLYTNLEFARFLSPEKMQSRLIEESLERRAEYVRELAAGIELARQEILADELPETYRTERMHYVATMDTELDEVFPSRGNVHRSKRQRADID